MKINYQSDFDFIYNPVDCRGEAIGFPPEGVDWRVEFRTHPSGKVLTASCIRGVCVNCFNDGSRIHVVAKDHGLAPGRLVSTMTILNPNGIYRPDSIQRLVDRQPVGIELVTGRTCLSGTAPGIDVSLPVIGYAGLKADIEQVASDLQTHINQYENLNDRFGSWSSAMEQEVQAVKSRIDSAESRLATLSSQQITLSREISTLSNRVATLESKTSEYESRFAAIEQAMWRYHERPALVARLVAIGYDETEAAERVDALVAVSTAEAEKGVALREQLATLRYTPTEIEECIEDVPALTQADIDYAKEILDAWDPATTSLANAYKDNTRLVIFPKIDTSNVTNTQNMFRGCRNLRFVPWFDTQKVTSANWTFGYERSTCGVRRIPDLQWPSLKRCYGPYSGANSITRMEHEFDFSAATFLCVTFAFSKITSPFPGIIFNTSQPLQLDQLFLDATINGPIPLTEVPDNVTQFSATYANVKGITPSNLSDVTIRARGATNGPSRMFSNTQITHAPKFDMPGADSFSSLFSWCNYLIQIPDYTEMTPDTVSDMLKSDSRYTSGHPLERVEGLNFAQVNEADLFGSDYTTIKQKSNLRYMRIVNLGQSELTAYDFSLATVWGTGSEEARQSLVNSLLTDSYDRAAAGMPPATIKLAAASKAVLTAEELAAITAKGFTIV